LSGAAKIGVDGISRADRETTPAADLTITVDGLRWRYGYSGSGPALLLVHGLLGHSFSWRRVIPALARQARVYAVDLPGSGFSDPPLGADAALRASSQRLLRFMDAIGVSRCDVLGSSYGGAVAMMAAALAPERFRRLMLAAPVNPWSSRGKLLARLVCSPPVAPFCLRILPRLDMLHEFYFRRLWGDTRRILPGTLAGYMEPLRKRGTLTHTLRVLQSWNRDLQELRSMLPRIAHLPTLLIWGNQDAAVNPASAQQLKRGFKDCRVLTLEGVGHLPYEEVPDEFNRAIAEFLTRTVPSEH
jgi:pimeloyl-ACP methyl ester carboxylesterase